MKKEQILECMQESTYKPLTADELIAALQVKNVQQFIDVLKELESQGSIILTRKNRYGITEKMGLFIGRIDAHARGFGFLVPEKAPDSHEGGDIFVAEKELNGAMHNDKVIVRLLPPRESKGKIEGEVIRILKRENDQLVGRLEKSANFGFVICDDKRIGKDIFIPAHALSGAKNGDKVVVKITRWPEARRNAEGKIIEVLGAENQPGIDILSIVRKYRLPEVFSDEVLKEAKRVAAEPIANSLQGRVDLRNLPMVTIDGADAKDLDDAVSLEFTKEGYYLGVHIADVGHYVRRGSILDKEAYERGTSVYLVDRVIPMLPHQLSNDICSLNPHVDRLSFSVFMEIMPNGEITDYQIKSSVININHRMTYDQVNAILDGHRELTEKYKDFTDTFLKMKELSLILKEKRTKRGSINFDFPESKVVLDEKGAAQDIVKVLRGTSEKIIEEFMIAANETVAQHMYELEAPFIYRIHEPPNEEDLVNLNEFLNALGYKVESNHNKVSPKSYQQVVDAVKGKPEEKSVNTVLLRSMKHAAYADICKGHFGLASEHYAHFTSPIRRYPDLVIHRIICESIARGAFEEKRKAQLFEFVNKAAEQCSIKERVAEEAERESVDMKKVEYMQRFLGETFAGVISGVTNFGFFVELENTVEGLVHVSTLTDDYYQFDEKHLVLRGRHAGEIFKIGQAVTVQVARVDVSERNIDFELVKD